MFSFRASTCRTHGAWMCVLKLSVQIISIATESFLYLCHGHFSARIIPAHWVIWRPNGTKMRWKNLHDLEHNISATLNWTDLISQTNFRQKHRLLFELHAGNDSRHNFLYRKRNIEMVMHLSFRRLLNRKRKIFVQDINIMKSSLKCCEHIRR